VLVVALAWGPSAVGSRARATTDALTCPADCDWDRLATVVHAQYVPKFEPRGRRTFQSPHRRAWERGISFTRGVPPAFRVRATGSPQGSTQKRNGA
jgi:hypothetical protein